MQKIKCDSILSPGVVCLNITKASKRSGYISRSGYVVRLYIEAVDLVGSAKFRMDYAFPFYGNRRLDPNIKKLYSIANLRCTPGNMEDFNKLIGTNITINLHGRYSDATGNHGGFYTYKFDGFSVPDDTVALNILEAEFLVEETLMLRHAKRMEEIQSALKSRSA